MSTVFHFFDSEEEDSEDEELVAARNKQAGWTKIVTRSQKETWKNIFCSFCSWCCFWMKTPAFFRELAEKLKELNCQKHEYTDGWWNVNSVLMGGLGNQPEIGSTAISLCNHRSYVKAHAPPVLFPVFFSVVCWETKFILHSFGFFRRWWKPGNSRTNVKPSSWSNSISEVLCKRIASNLSGLFIRSEIPFFVGDFGHTQTERTNVFAADSRHRIVWNWKSTKSPGKCLGDTANARDV